MSNANSIQVDFNPQRKSEVRTRTTAIAYAPKIYLGESTNEATYQEIIRVSKLQAGDSASLIGENYSTARNFYVKMVDSTIVSYFTHVGYRLESVLVLLLCIPAVALIATSITENVIFRDSTVLFVYRLVMCVLAAASILSSSYINSRIEVLHRITMTIQKKITFLILSNSPTKPKANLILYFFLFYVVITNQLSLVTTPIPNYVARVQINSLSNPIVLNNTNTVDPIDAALGLKAICSECNAIISQNTLLVPLTEKLSNINLLSKDILIESNQDVVAVKSICATEMSNNANLSSGVIQTQTTSVASNSNKNYINMVISSISSYTGNQYTQNCTITTTDLNSNVSTIYRKSSLGPYRYSGIYSINNSTLSNCTVAGTYCLDKSKRNPLSLLLLGKLATISSTSIFKSESLYIFPDPSLITNDATFSLELSLALSKIMIMQAISLSSDVDSADVYNTSSQFQISIQPILRLMQIALAGLCILFDIGRIIWYVYLLRDVNDNLLRRLSQNVVPGQWQLQDLSDFIEKYHKKKRWMDLPLEFGEDKYTAEEDVGKLIFGTSKMVNPITRGKLYR